MAPPVDNTVTWPKSSLSGITDAMPVVPVPVIGSNFIIAIGSSQPITTCALRAPAADGENVTVNLIDAPPSGTVDGSIGRLLSLKSAASGPVMAIDVTCRSEKPLLLMFTSCACEVWPTRWLPKMIAPRSSAICGSPASPAIGVTSDGFTGSSDTTVSTALALPFCVGVKVSVVGNDAFGPSVLGRPGTPVSEKRAASGPVTVTAVMCSCAPPELAMVTVIGGCGWPKSWPPTVIGDGLTLAVGPMPLPEIGTSMVAIIPFTFVETTAVRRLIAVGAKATSIVVETFCPSSAGRPGPFESTKSPGFAPASVIEAMVTPTLPELVKRERLHRRLRAGARVGERHRHRVRRELRRRAARGAQRTAPRRRSRSSGYPS